MNKALTILTLALLTVSTAQGEGLLKKKQKRDTAFLDERNGLSLVEKRRFAI